MFHASPIESEHFRKQIFIERLRYYRGKRNQISAYLFRNNTLNEHPAVKDDFSMEISVLNTKCSQRRNVIFQGTLTAE